MPAREPMVVSCEIEVTLRHIGGKYKTLILHHLQREGCLRFNALQHAIPGISQKTLTNQLREMEQDGLITRTIYAETPPRVEYRLSEKGRTLEPLLELMCQWGHAHAENFVLTHGQCGGSCD